MDFYGNLFKYLTALSLPRSRAELNTIIDGRVDGGGSGGGTSSGVTAILSSEIMVLPADAAGNVISFVDAVTHMTILVGPNDDTFNWTITRVNGIGVTSVLTGATLSVTGLTSDSAYVNLTATKAGYSPITKRFTVTKARQGQPGSPGAPGGEVTPDPTPPPTPVGLSATAGISQFTVQWTQAAYSEGHGPKQTVIYAIPQSPLDSNLPVFNENAAIVSVADPINIISIPSNPYTKWFIWAKFESNDGYRSATPAGGLNGVQVTTGQDVSTLLTALTGSITQSQLFSTLSTRINLIDAPSGTVGSVNARIVTETNNRITAINTEITNRTNAIAASATTLSTDYINRDASILSSANTYASSYVQNYTYSTAGVNGAISTQISTLTASIGNSGGNLLSNSSFEVDTDGNGTAGGWSVYSSSAATISFTAGRIGGNAQRVSWTGTNVDVKGIYTNSTMTDGGITGGVRGGWAPNRNYVISWYCKAAPGAAGFTMQLAHNISPASQVALSNPPLSSTVWQRYSFSILTGSSVPSNGELYFTILNGAAATGYLDYDDAQVQEGTLLTGYSAGDSPVLAAAIQTETTARINGDSANANAITTLQSTTALFSPLQSWEFTGTADSWTGLGGFFGSLSTGATKITGVANSSSDLIIQRDLAGTEQFSGALYDKVRARIRRISGGGWYGYLFYGVVSGHADSSLYYKIAPEPNWSADPNGWALVEWDMSNLTAGGTDWVSNTINRLRIDILRSGAGPAGTSFEIDWIAVGSRSSGVSSAIVQQEISTRASQTGALFAQYTVKVDVNGYVSGFGLASTATGAAPTSNFIVRADNFAIASPTGPGIASVIPFSVQTTPTTIGGVTVPVGVYMDAAFIKNGTITNLKVANGAIDNLKVSGIDASKINTGLLVAGQIDTRNLSIRDGAGNIILSAGSPLSIDNIQNGNSLRNNLVDASWWRTGVDPGVYWLENDSDPGESAIVWGEGPKGNYQALYRCIAAGVAGSGPDGGWGSGNLISSPTNAFLVDRTKTYRFAVPVFRTSGSGATYWGLAGDPVCNLNTSTENTNPYFASSGALVTGRWCLMVGYVFPAGSTGLGNAGSGIFDLTTGALIVGGSNFCWGSTTTYSTTRAYQFYATTGATQIFAPPMVHIVDGSEPSLNEYFQSTAVLNSNVSINANGTLTGGGTGQVTITGLGYTGDLNASSDISLVASAGMSLTGNSATKISGGDNWNQQVYSRDSYTGGAYASVIVPLIGHNIMFGLNTDPLANASYDTIDYAIFLNTSNVLEVYESGVGTSTGIGYAVGDALAVVYDGSYVKYLKNGVSIKTPTPVADGLRFFFDSSFFTMGSRLTNMRFGPMSSTAWGSITGQPGGIYNTNITVDTNGNLQGAGTVVNVANNQGESGTISIRFPQGGAIGSSNPAQGGALKIRLPRPIAFATMMRFEIEIYEYNSNASASYDVGGFIYSGGWANVFARYIGIPSNVKSVRFGHDGVNACVWLGDSGTVWSYPQVRIKDLLISYDSVVESYWSTGWTVSWDPTGAINVTGTIANPVPGGAISGVDQITSSNATTYIAAAAIGSAQIGSVDAGTITVGSMNASRIAAGTITTDRIQVGAVSAASSVLFNLGTTAISSGATSYSSAIIPLGNFVSTGAPVNHMATVSIYGFVATAVKQVEMYFTLNRDGAAFNDTRTRRVGTLTFNNTQQSYDFTIPVIYRDPVALPAGSRAYSLQVQLWFYTAAGLLVAAGANSDISVQTRLVMEENKV